MLGFDSLCARSGQDVMDFTAEDMSTGACQKMHPLFAKAFESAGTPVIDGKTQGLLLRVAPCGNQLAKEKI